VKGRESNETSPTMDEEFGGEKFGETLFLLHAKI